MSSFHTPVLLREVIEGLVVKEGEKYIDATIGGGGHGWEIVKRGGVLLGIDADPEAIEVAREKLKSQNTNLKKNRWRFVHGNFREIEKIAKENGFTEVDGVLFDLGVSSYQLDTGEKGFSYRFREAPLDLRFDPSEGSPAAAIVNETSAEELYEIFARFGEEQLAGTIADVIIRTRRMKPIQTTGDLIAIVSTIVKNPIHLRATISRIFQALRIATNDELTSLRQGLAQTYDLLAPKGRLAVISFHSLEDRIVKQTMAGSRWRVLTKNPLCPTNEEVLCNRRSRSAKLRIAEKL